MSRGDRREDIFGNDQDRSRFLETLSGGCQKTTWQIHAFCPAGAGHRPETSRRLQDDVIGLMGCVCDGSENIIPLQKCVVLQNLFE
jgi:hypothetical protein